MQLGTFPRETPFINPKYLEAFPNPRQAVATFDAQVVGYGCSDH